MAVTRTRFQNADPGGIVRADERRLAEAHLHGLLVAGVQVIPVRLVCPPADSPRQLHLLMVWRLQLVHLMVATVHQGGVNAAPAKDWRHGTRAIAVSRLPGDNQQLLLGQTGLLGDAVLVLVVGVQTATAHATIPLAMMQSRTTGVPITPIIAPGDVDDVVVRGIKAGQHVLELLAEVLVQPGVQEGIVAGGAHGNRVGHKEE